jgi:protein-serine/threonine kinase
MSSAALQTAPHQSTSVSAHSPVAAAPSNRPYTSGSSQSRDPYYNQNTSNASPSSNRRPTRRPSGNGASQNNSQSPAQYYSPNPPSAPQMTTRPNDSNHNSPSLQPPPTGGYSSMSPGDHQRGVPPVVSARTSSNRNSTSAAAPGTERSSRRERRGDAANSPRAASHDGQQDRSDRQRSNGNTQANGAAEDARSRRRAQQSGESLPHRPSGSREPRSQQSAMAQRAAQTPGGPSREASEILNRVVISKPEIDLDRERERMAEAVPSSPPSQATPRASEMTSSDGVEDSGRAGTRSRHDHAASSGRKEKNSKFGDYYLGNTLGEGEFGKVKMGWKTNGVEVSQYRPLQLLLLIPSRLRLSSFVKTTSLTTLVDWQRSIERSSFSSKYHIRIL